MTATAKLMMDYTREVQGLQTVAVGAPRNPRTHIISLADRKAQLENAHFALPAHDRNVSPGAMKAACLVFGLSVSSFLYRHREQDRFQSAFVLFVSSWTIVVGYGAGATALFLSDLTADYRRLILPS